jgi:hypothetical protein
VVTVPLASIAFALVVALAALSVLGLVGVSFAGFSVAEWRRGGESWGSVALAGGSLVVVAGWAFRLGVSIKTWGGEWEEIKWFSAMVFFASTAWLSVPPAVCWGLVALCVRVGAVSKGDVSSKNLKSPEDRKGGLL